MYTISRDCPVKKACLKQGNGETIIKQLATEDALYNHARMFAEVTLEPGCSIGYHTHEHETEFYYIISGEGCFDDNGEKVTVHTGDICATGYGQGHGLMNCGTTPLKVIALIMMEH